ncbi:hypothetical protein GUITHDRAFT_122859 [Guillardia theta CCMP2712]|uniref:Uncharacterized protein n=1 Tax=Guillardia theta (strain CCMP2712) TaxID=905079 RepID=L1I3Y2_GUITC|nr:hypothetical protein GUITHDRAFT_122859 [Guillardia theta CCMP2712]EKX30936.1 hypothetical protein GUITHDRAFT_122859 [Guillardia theta CCMP2712]|eukprot:XP_005817916.1 hypothetical protein GUITHDRAFT_122859 [Guillardia theta CCMP2712]
MERGRGRDLGRKKARDKQNALVTREQTKKLLDVLDPLIPQGERSLGELRGSLPSRRTLLHLLEDLVTHLRAMPASSRASRKERKPGVSLEEATARVMSSRRERIVSVELPSWRIKCGSVGLEGKDSASSIWSRTRAWTCYERLGRRCRVIPAHVSCMGEGVFVLEAQEEAEVRHAWPGDLVGKFCMVVRRDPGTSNACAYDIDQALRGLVSESRGFMMEALKVLSTDHASQSIMERVRGSMQSLGSSFATYMSRLADTHLSLGMDEENNPFVDYYVRMRLPQLVGGFKSNWKRVMKMAYDGGETELGDENTNVHGFVHNQGEEDLLKVTMLYLHSSTGICYFSRRFTTTPMGTLQSVRVFRDGSDEVK